LRFHGVSKQQYSSTNIIHVACFGRGRQGALWRRNDDEGRRPWTCLVNNIGFNIRKPILEQTEEEFHNMIMFSDLFDPAGATIVNVSSAAGVQSSGTGAAHGLSKATLNQYTKILACEWAARKIRVNALTPW
jgi:Tropinone reductase 1